VVGPDGFPDFTYGQSVIHPEQTGKWPKHVLTKARQAQIDPSYSAAERGQILAFPTAISRTPRATCGRTR
jgi:hypothetical protein